jgi:hypothetical protein
VLNEQRWKNHGLHIKELQLTLDWQICVTEFLFLWQNTWHKQHKEERFMVSVHGHLTSCFWACGWGNISWWKGVMEESSSPHGARKQRVWEGVETRCEPVTHFPSWPLRAHSSSSRSNHLSTVQLAGNQAFNTWTFWEDTHIQTLTHAEIAERHGKECRC